MAYKIVEKTYCPTMDDDAYVFILDSVADLGNLPECGAGSVAKVADKDGAVYMMNASGEWREL